MTVDIRADWPSPISGGETEITGGERARRTVTRSVGEFAEDVGLAESVTV